MENAFLVKWMCKENPSRLQEKRWFHKACVGEIAGLVGVLVKQEYEHHGM
jgi:hypothetical protein